MPFALFFVATILIVTAFRGTTGQFFSTLTGDIAGFVVWIVAIGVVGAIGYIPGLKKISDGFLVLILLVMFISNKGFFANFNQQINAIKTDATSGGLGSTPVANGAGSTPNIFQGGSGINPIEGLTPLSSNLDNPNGGISTTTETPQELENSPGFVSFI